MASSIAWLDTSADEQRRIREMLKLFTQTESRDELGLGQVRDALADTLFPGVSTLHTRSRYFFIVTWAYQRALAGRLSPADLPTRVEAVERRLIEPLRESGDWGVIGARAGRRVKNLPSTVYWTGLRTYGILNVDALPTRFGRQFGELDLPDELAERVLSPWPATLPEAPPGFPTSLEGGLTLTRDEAAWLRERIVRSCPNTLLAHVMTAPWSEQNSPAPWLDSVAMTAEGDAAVALDHAELFSRVMHGTALLYNLMLAETYVTEGFTAIGDLRDAHRSSFTLWADEVPDWLGRLRAWDRAGFWHLVRTQNPNVSARTQQHVHAWVELVTERAVSADDELARGLVTARERAVKGPQARLTNRKLLEKWGGSSGSAALVYRWPQVKAHLTDIHGALADAAS